MPWSPNPDNPIGLSESIARRLYDEPQLAGATDQAPLPLIDVRHFEETRGKEVSVDRCGQTGVERAVVNYLSPRAQQMGNSFKPPKAFSGWLYVRARDLIKPS